MRGLIPAMPCWQTKKFIPGKEGIPLSVANMTPKHPTSYVERRTWGVSAVSLNCPIHQTSIVKEVIARITDSLIKGELKPGDKLPSEMDLCQSLGVGRNSLREAIKMLAALGVLQVRRGDGTYVSQTVSASLLDPLLYSLILQRGTPYELFELRTQLEVDFVELASVKATPEDIEKCQKTIDELKKAFTRGESDVDILLELDLAFHYAVMEACHNPLLERIGRTVLRLFMGTIIKALVIDPERSIVNHQKILEVIRRREPAKAHEVVIGSLEKWRDILAQQKTVAKNRESRESIPAGGK